MRPFEHVGCTSVEDATTLLRGRNGRARAIAGGTDLLGTLKDRIHPDYPEVVVNLKTIPDLDLIREDEDGLRIGALTKLDVIARHPIISEKYTVLAEAARSVASPQIRRMATLGGNLCQETRCWYYRHPDNFFHCLRKGGDICGALVGENRYHSIMGAVRMKRTSCSVHCPAETDIADYIERLRAGDLDDAARILLRSNPFPAVTGRVCPHYCQQACNRAELDQAVSIREVERVLGDHVLEHIGSFFHPPEKETGNQVAVVGSGPAGLAAAYALRTAGHEVTVFERLAKPGGMLAYTIPAYRLPAAIVERTTGYLEAMGIVFRCGIEIGKDLSVEHLRRDFDALFLGTGAWKGAQIDLEGTEHTQHGLQFLKSVREGRREAPGRRVVVIGGGNVAVDVAISAKRLGSEDVTLICLESPDEMPALDWELEQAHEEQVGVLSSWGPQRVLTSEGKVCGLDLVRCTSVFDEEGRFAPKFDPARTMTVDADAVVLAVGQRAESAFLPAEVMAEQGWTRIDDSGRTSVRGVYAGGDAVRPANVIDAIAAGRRAAVAIHADLTGESLEPPTTESRFLTFDPRSTQCNPAHEATRIPIEARSIEREDTTSLSLSAVEAEARRCLNCGCVAVTPSDMGTALVALSAVIQTTNRVVPAGEFFACRERASTVLELGELVTEVRIPKAKSGSRSAYRKFRRRQSIDFAIVSAAVCLDVAQDKVRDARVVLGAVAPVPLRAQAAEDYLRGKDIKEILAPSRIGALPELAGARAADLAAEGAIPLAENEYKVQLARAMVRRAILASLS